MQRAYYGIDVPGLVRGFVLAAGGLIAAGGVAALAVSWGIWLAAVLGVFAVYPLGMALFMIRFSRVTKVSEREAILVLVAWRGDEAVLDVGCGRGLMLVGAARRLTGGRATGIDIWPVADQTGNTAAAAARERALAEMARVLRPAGTILLTDIVDRRRDAVLRAISIGSFTPATIIARRA